MPLLPVAVYGLEVPAGDIPVPALVDFPATFRITMAAIDPTASPSAEATNGTSTARSTLKLIRQPTSPSDDDSEDEEDYMRALLAGADSDEDSEDDEEEEEVNGGPSDPEKSKKARKEAALKQLLESIDKDSDDDMEDVENGLNGSLKVIKKGKAKAADDEDEDSDESEDDDDSEDAEPEEFVVCTLDPEKTYQQTLDITIGENEEVYFKVSGTHTIYLTGNYVIADDNGHNHHHEVYDSDSDDEEVGDYDLSPDEDELELELEGDESDELDDLADPRVTEVDSDDEPAPKLIPATEKKGKNKRSADELEINGTLDDMMTASLKTENAVNGEEKLSKKQLKKLKNSNGNPVATKSEDTKEGSASAAKDSPASAKSDKKVQFAKNLEQGPTGSTVNGKTEKPKATLGVKTVNGVKVDDKKLGTGPAAKNGDKVGLRYIGKLMDGKVFDSNKKGKPFQFKLGAGEVIQGWDIGVAGMTVGGERRLTIPASLAYGKKGVPGIPPNSTLVFDVKLLEIK